MGIGAKLNGRVTHIPDPPWKGWVVVETDAGEDQRHLRRLNLRFGLDITNDVKVGDEVECTYARYGGGALWFARKKEDEV